MMKCKWLARLIGIVGLSFLLVNGVYAQTPEEKGLEIAKEAERRDNGWVDSQASMVMTLRNKVGKESVREIRIHSLEVPGDGDKALNIFDHPADVKGTAFLSFTHALTPDEQWLYLPALKRVKRISSANKSGPFMGSEFAFEDLSSQELAKFKYKFIKEEAIDGQDMYVIERTPQYEHSGYTRQIVWLDKEHYRMYKSEFYDRKNELLKTLVAGGYQQYLDQFWRPDTMDMVNHVTGKSTSLKWQNYKFANGFTDRDFDQNTLKRAR